MASEGMRFSAVLYYVFCLATFFFFESIRVCPEVVMECVVFVTILPKASTTGSLLDDECRYFLVVAVAFGLAFSLTIV